MKRNFWKVVYRCGHRGAFLLFLALLDGLYGYSLFIEPGPTVSIDLWFPVPVWAIIWLVTGLILLTGVFAIHDRIHYALAATVKAAWAAAWLNIWIFGTVPRAWISVVIWAAFAATVVVVSSWPEKRRERVTEPSEGEL